MKLKQIIEETDTRAGRLFDLGVQFLIVVSLVSFSLDTLPDLGPQARDILLAVEVATVLLFTAEYLLRVLVAERKLAYIFSFFGLIDLLAILPFYLMPAVDLRGLRIVRLMRLFRVLKFVRYTRALKRFRDAFFDIKEELVIYLIATAFLLFISSVGIYYFEHEVQPDHFGSVFHAMWWSVATLTTVGYGDVFPITVGGRLFTSLLLLIGLGVIAVPSGLFAAALTKEQK